MPNYWDAHPTTSRSPPSRGQNLQSIEETPALAGSPFLDLRHPHGQNRTGLAPCCWVKTKYHQEWVHEHPSRTLFWNSMSIFFLEDVKNRNLTSAAVPYALQISQRTKLGDFLGITWLIQIPGASPSFAFGRHPRCVSDLVPVQLTEWKIPKGLSFRRG